MATPTFNTAVAGYEALDEAPFFKYTKPWYNSMPAGTFNITHRSGEVFGYIYLNHSQKWVAVSPYNTFVSDHPNFHEAAEAVIHSY